MRGKLTDQDFTDYALNELQPEERLYVESMLAVSEECRHDVYEMIEFSQMLEEGFEMADQKIVPIMLKPEQRQQLLEMQVSGRWVAKSAAGLAAAACAAFALTHPGLWEAKGPAALVAQTVSTRVTNYVTEAVNTTVSTVSAAEGDDVITQPGTFRKIADDPALKKWFTTDWLSPEFATSQGPWAQPAATWDPMPHAALDMP